MIFFEKEEDGVKKWEMQIDQKIPCTEKEKKIYGVDYKIDPNASKPWIIELDFADGGKFYRVFSGTYYSVFTKPDFKDLKKAQEFLLNQFKGK